MPQPRLTLTVASLLALMSAACSNNAELTAKIDQMNQCIGAPDSITQTFERAKTDNRLPIYVSDLNRDQYENQDWYQAQSKSLADVEIGLEDWSGLSNLQDCRVGVAQLLAEYPKNEAARDLSAFLDFTASTFDIHGDHQLEESNLELFMLISDEQTCLWLQSYPQAFIQMGYDLKTDLYPKLFEVTWDDDTLTYDGRSLLWRAIPSVADTKCTQERDSKPRSWINYALTWDSLIDLTEAEYYDHIKKVRELTDVVDSYNQLANERLQELKEAGDTIPPMADYESPVIYQYEATYLSNVGLNELLSDCTGTPVKSFVNGRGENLYSIPQTCRAIQSLCDGPTTPAIPKKVCEAVERATDLSNLGGK